MGLSVQSLRGPLRLNIVKRMGYALRKPKEWPPHCGLFIGANSDWKMS